MFGSYISAQMHSNTSSFVQCSFSDGRISSEDWTSLLSLSRWVSVQLTRISSRLVCSVTSIQLDQFAKAGRFSSISSPKVSVISTNSTKVFSLSYRVWAGQVCISFVSSLMCVLVCVYHLFMYQLPIVDIETPIILVSIGYSIYWGS